jgi:hypothetical protein
MTKRQGATSDNGLIFKFFLEDLANPANRPISEKLPKWHYLILFNVIF